MEPFPAEHRFVQLLRVARRPSTRPFSLRSGAFRSDPLRHPGRAIAEAGTGGLDLLSCPLDALTSANVARNPLKNGLIDQKPCKTIGNIGKSLQNHGKAYALSLQAQQNHR